MRISILSDFHFGFANNTEREEDSFNAAKEAIEKALDSDLILIAGDMFDVKIPNTETFVKAMQLLMKLLFVKKQIKLVEDINKDINKISRLALSGIPIIAISGTHERRIKGLLNPVQALERAGFLIYLHCNGVVFEKNGERVCIQGVSGVPDQYTLEILQKWAPRPIENCFNILMLHQSLSEFIYSPHAVSMKKLPPGFNLYICGHVHESKKENLHNTKLLIPGSTIPVQLSKEAMQARGFWQIETNNMELKFVELENQRKFYYEEFQTPNPEIIENKIKEILSEQHEQKPLIRIKVYGKGLLLDSIARKFEDKAIISFKEEYEEEAIPIKTLEEHKLSVQELGRKLLLQNLTESKLNPQLFEQVFELLLNEKSDQAIRLLSEEKEHIREKEISVPEVKAKEEGIKEIGRIESKKQEIKEEYKKKIKPKRGMTIQDFIKT